MKKEIDRLLTEEIPKLIEFDLVTSVEVKGWFYLVTSVEVKGWFYVIRVQNYLKQDIELLNNPIYFYDILYHQGSIC